MNTKILLISLSLLCLMPCKAQEKPIDAFEHDDAMWVSCLIPDNAIRTFFVEPNIFKFGGDTIIDGETWKLVDAYRLPIDSIKTLQPNFDKAVLSTRSTACLRKEGNRIYARVSKDGVDTFIGDAYLFQGYDYDNRPVLLYDFDAEKGDTIPVIPIEEINDKDLITYHSIVKENGVKEINGVMRRYYTKGYDEYVEGIGTLRDLFAPLLDMTTGENTSLLLCTAGGKELFRDFHDFEAKYCYDLFCNDFHNRLNKVTWTMAKNDNGHIHSPYKVTRDGFNMYVPGMDSVDFYINVGYEGKVSCARFEKGLEGEEFSLYDFSLSEGDVFNNGVYSATVEKIDTIMKCGYERVRYHMSNGDCWIDGIGSIYGPLHTIYGGNDVLLSCEADGIVYYRSPDYSMIEEETAETAGTFTAYEADGILHINGAAGTGFEMRLYSISGKLILSKSCPGNSCTLPVNDLPGGVYLVSVSDGDVTQTLKFIKK